MFPYKSIELEDLENEIWVDAIYYDGYYQVSNLGRIKTLSRIVLFGNRDRIVHEKIRKQVLGKDGRLTCPLSIEGKNISINIPALIFFSFNTKLDYTDRTFCIMHKNKLQCDNRLSNLVLEKITQSHKLNFKKKLLPHLKANNDKKRAEYLLIKEKTCSKCGITKDITLFEYGRNKCYDCRKQEQSKRRNTHSFL
ncbi:MAG: NUMOD4 domain-containing protein [Paludibacter sp.]